MTGEFSGEVKVIESSWKLLRWLRNFQTFGWCLGGKPNKRASYLKTSREKDLNPGGRTQHMKRLYAGAALKGISPLGNQRNWWRVLRDFKWIVLIENPLQDQQVKGDWSTGKPHVISWVNLWLEKLNCNTWSVDKKRSKATWNNACGS